MNTDTSQFNGHTPEGWRHGGGNFSNRVEGPTGKLLYDGDDGFRTVCMVQPCEPTGKHDAEEANQRANIALICAAASLLRERNELRVALEQMVDGASMLEAHIDCENWSMDGEIRAANEVLARCGK